MDVEGVLPGWQILHLHDNLHPFGGLGQGGFPHLLPLVLTSVALAVAGGLWPQPSTRASANPNPAAKVFRSIMSPLLTMVSWFSPGSRLSGELS